MLDLIELKEWHEAQRGADEPSWRRRSMRLPEDHNDQTARHDIYLPSPDEIQSACREIQSEWSPEERQRRSGERPLPTQGVRIYRIAR